MQDRIRPAMLAGALLALGACGDLSAPDTNHLPANLAATNTAQPAGTVVVDANYSCQPAMTLAVRYDNSDPAASTAQVTLDGAQYAMSQVRAADGAKYMSGTGRSEGRTLIWWTRGAEGTLFEGSASDPMAEETELARCTETAAPTNE